MRRLLITILFLAAATPVQAATYYVAKTGSDGNSCSAAQSQATPKMTINAGVACLSGGDTLYVKNGIYQEGLYGVIPGGTSGNPTTIAAHPGETVTLQAVSIAHRHFIWLNQSWITIDGLIIDGNRIAYDAIQTMRISPSAGVTGIVVKNSELKNSTGHALFGVCHSCTFRNLDVHHWGVVDDYLAGNPATYISGNNLTIENSQFHDSINGSGIGIWHTGEPYENYTNQVVRNNRVWNIRYRGTNAGRAALAIYCGSNSGDTQCLVYNNVVYDSDAGISLTYNSYNSQVYNNTVVGTDHALYGTCINVEHTASVSVRNNVCWKNKNNAVLVIAGATTTVSNNLLDDPLFVNSAALDFRLQNSSNAIDAGFDLSGIVSNDFDGVTRPQGRSHDIGAYEFSTSSSARPAPPSNLRIVSQ